MKKGCICSKLFSKGESDKIGRKCNLSGNFLNKYKNKIEILPFGFDDNMNEIVKSGTDSSKLNQFLNTQIELKKLTFHTSSRFMIFFELFR